jgi:hypothetical protein
MERSVIQELRTPDSAALYLDYTAPAGTTDPAYVSAARAQRR